jgi:hypothetical protein
VSPRSWVSLSSEIEIPEEGDSQGADRAMKNQPFHQRKIRIRETPELDYEQLKNRTVIALNKLGQQKFSAEPGGYSIENWIRGVNVLLDEFEEKMSEGRLPADYFERRRELNTRLSEPVSTSSIDKTISEIKQSIADVEGRIEAEKSRIASRIIELKDEQTRCSANLAQEQRRISDLATEPRSDSFFKRLFAGNSKASTKNTETKVQELESRLRALPDEILEQQRHLKLVGMGSPGSPFAEEWSVLDSLQAKLQALESERLERVQLVKEREQVTTSIADAISRIHV